MAVPEHTPHRRVELLSTGHYRTGATYKTWRPAGTDDWLLLVTESGEGVAGSGGRFVTLRAGGVALYKPGAPQDYRTNREARVPRWHFRWAHFRPSSDLLPWLAWPEMAEGFLCVQDLPPATYRAVMAAMAEALRHQQKAEPVEDAMAMNAMERAILQVAGHCRSHTRDGDPRIERAVKFISKNLDRPLTLQDLATAVGMSVSHFCHTFPRQTGQSPLAFVEACRMRQAAMRLRLEDETISEIAEKLGYGSAFYFTNRFRRHHGMSPTAYRKSKRPREEGKQSQEEGVQRLATGRRRCQKRQPE